MTEKELLVLDRIMHGVSFQEEDGKRIEPTPELIAAYWDVRNND